MSQTAIVVRGPVLHQGARHPRYDVPTFRTLVWGFFLIAVLLILRYNITFSLSKTASLPYIHSRFHFVTISTAEK